MKKFICLIFFLVMCISFTGCKDSMPEVKDYFNLEVDCTVYTRDVEETITVTCDRTSWYSTKFKDGITINDIVLEGALVEKKILEVTQIDDATLILKISGKVSNREWQGNSCRGKIKVKAEKLENGHNAVADVIVDEPHLVFGYITDTIDSNHICHLRTTVTAKGCEFTDYCFNGGVFTNIPNASIEITEATSKEFKLYISVDEADLRIDEKLKTVKIYVIVDRLATTYNGDILKVFYF